MQRSCSRVTSVKFSILFFCSLWLTATGDAAVDTAMSNKHYDQESTSIPQDKISVECTLSDFSVVVMCELQDTDSNCSIWCKGKDNGMCCQNNDCMCCSDDQIYIDGHCSFSLRFMVAAQIALGVALLLAVSALTFLVWKMCFRNNISHMSARNRMRVCCGLPELSRRGSRTGSLNSMQRFVIQKLRDRPPRYEESPPQMPPCYDEITSSGTTVAPHGLSGVFPSSVGYSPPYMESTSGEDCVPPYSITASFPQSEINQVESGDVASGGEDLYPYHLASGFPLNTVIVNEESTSCSRNPANLSTISTEESAGPVHDSYRIGRRHRPLLDEAAGGFDNPAFNPDIPEQHI